MMPDINKVGSKHYYYTLKHLLPECYICFIDSKSRLKQTDLHLIETNCNKLILLILSLLVLRNSNPNLLTFCMRRACLFPSKTVH